MAKRPFPWALLGSQEGAAGQGERGPVLPLWQNKTPLGGVPGSLSSDPLCGDLYQVQPQPSLRLPLEHPPAALATGSLPNPLPSWGEGRPRPPLSGCAPPALRDGVSW